MKKILPLILLFVFLRSSANPPDINEKVLSAFNSTFTKAENVIWREMDETCQANFTQDQIVLRAIYDMEGNLLQTVRYYGQGELPANIRIKLNRHHPGKEIYGVTEILENDELLFSIMLRDEKNWYRVNATSYGQLTLVEKFKRGEPEAN